MADDGARRHPHATSELTATSPTIHQLIRRISVLSLLTVSTVGWCHLGHAIVAITFHSSAW